MKRILFVMIAFLGMLTVNAQNNSLKVVVTADGDLVGRYVRQTSTTYIANPLDWEVEVSKKDHRVEIWTPEKGKGFVVRRDGVTGNLNVRKGPSTRYAVVCQITEEDSNKDYPEETRQDKHYSRKLKAELFIDDRNLGGLPDWGTIYRMINEKLTLSDIARERLGHTHSSERPKKKHWWQV